MASTRGYSAIPEGYVFVAGDAGEIIDQLPAESLDRVQIAAGYGVLVPGDVKLPKGLSAEKPGDDETVESLASIEPEPVIEIPAGETPEQVDGGSAPADSSADSTAS